MTDRFAPPLWLLFSLQLAVSAASLVVEIVAGRMLAPYVGMSLYTWTSIIAVVLAGFSAGHWWGGILAGRSSDRALIATGWAMVAATITTGLALPLLKILGQPVLGAVGHPIWGIGLLSLLVFFLPSLFAGIPAPVLTQIALRGRPQDSGRALGALFAAGAVGAIAGTLLAGFLFISWLGSAGTLVVVCLTYGVAAAACFALAHKVSIPAVIALMLGIGTAAWTLASPNPCDRESRYFCLRSVDVSADPDNPVHLMVIDHLVHGISARDLPGVMFTDHAAMLERLARVRGGPGFSSFHIGGGTYSLPRSFADTGEGPVTVAEIDPAVTEMAIADFWFEPGETRILHQDARRALTEDETRYDVVIGDAFTDIAVPAHLVTREFFELVRSRLEPGGAYLMNVIDFEDRLDALGAVTRTLAEVFPTVEIWTERKAPAPGERLVFVLVAADAETPLSQIRVPSPAQTDFAAMSPGFVADLIAESDLILTDNYAPIDRLIGRPD